MNNIHSIWSPNVSPSESTIAADDYNNDVGHHHLSPMTMTTSSSSNINTTFQFGPLSTDYSTNGRNEILIQCQNSSEYANAAYHSSGFDNNGLMSASSSSGGIITNRCSSGSSHHNSSAVPLDYSGHHQHHHHQSLLPFESQDGLFQSGHFVTPMGYTHGDPSFLYTHSNNIPSIFDTLHISEGGFLDSVARNTYTAGAIFQSTIAPYFNSPTAHMAPPPAKRRAGGRRPKEEESKLPPEEEEKRRLRRLRNKEAAARCRKRRLDQMSTLEIKVNELQNRQSGLETELDRLMQEKGDLEFILRAHESICQRRDVKSFTTMASSMMAANLPVKVEASESDSEDHDAMMEEEKEVVDQDPTLSSVMVKAKGSIDIDPIARPNTLSLANTSTSIGAPTMPSFETPSKELFHLLNQPTGLTPITSGGLTPFLFVSTTGSSVVPSLETPSVAESKIGPNSLTKL